MNHDVNYLKDESYLRLTKQPLGYLINFGRAGGVDFKRIILSEFLTK